MWRLVVIVLIICSIATTECLLADYLKPCSRTKNFTKCAIAHGNDALPMLLKGEKRLKIPNLLPLRFPKVEVDAGPNLQISLTEIDLVGLETVTLSDFKLDCEKQLVFIDLHAKRISLLGKYQVDGKILVLPIKGNGPINITIEDSQFQYTFKYKLEKKKGEDYAMIEKDDHLELKISAAHFQLDNLFDGNKQMVINTRSLIKVNMYSDNIFVFWNATYMRKFRRWRCIEMKVLIDNIDNSLIEWASQGDNVNKFLNENDQEVIKEIGGAVSGTITMIIRKVGGGLLSSLPFDEIFLP